MGTTTGQGLFNATGIPIMGMVGGAALFVIFLFGGMRKRQETQDKEGVKLISFFLALFGIVEGGLAIFHLFNYLWYYGVMWLLAGVLSIYCGLAVDEYLAFLNGLLNALVWFANIGIDTGFGNNATGGTVLALIQEAGCIPFFEYADLSEETKSDRCDDKEYLQWLRIVTFALLFIQFFISVMSFKMWASLRIKRTSSKVAPAPAGGIQY